MKHTRPVAISNIGLLGVALAGALTGCAGYDDRPRYQSEYRQPPPVYAESGVVVEPQYVYYPGYETYYSSNTHQYVYREGRAWRSAPAPRRGVSVEALARAPSVRLDFHDHPSNHHSTVVQQYPKRWAPPADSHNHEPGNDREGRR
jgi:hypothetical protein